MPDWSKEWYTARYALGRAWKWLLLGLLLNAAMAAMNGKVMGNRFGSRPCRSGKAVFA